MGVAGFTSFMRRRYPDAFVSQQGATVDHLYLDLSSTLHQILRKGKSVFYLAELLGTWSMVYLLSCRKQRPNLQPRCLRFAVPHVASLTLSMSVII